MTTVVTQSTGGTAKPVGILYVEPDLQVPDPGSGSALVQAGLNAAFLSDLLSACLAHERCGVLLYRSVAGRTTEDELRERYAHFGDETAEHVRLLEELAVSAGGDPHYVSPSARATEKTGAGLVESTYALAGSVDPVTAELAMLEAVLLAEAKDRANWELMAQIGARMRPGEFRSRFEAVAAQVLAQEEEHWSWSHDARAAMLFELATSGAAPAPSGSDTTVDLTSMTRDELYTAAQELEIEGRSQMKKEQLAKAVSEQTGGVR